jgi:hypothetical protein
LNLSRLGDARSVVHKLDLSNRLFALEHQERKIKRRGHNLNKAMAKLLKSYPPKKKK